MRIATIGAIAMLAIGLAAPAPAQTDAAGRDLATVRIPETVLADGQPLAPGTYQLVLVDERPVPLAGQSPDAQRRVAFLVDGKVVARDIAEVLRDSDLPPVGASARPAADGTRVELLKGGEFLRISVKRGDERYLIHLPVSRP